MTAVHTRTTTDRAAPRSLLDVTPEWLSEVIGAEVEAVVSEGIGQGVGFIGQLARCHLAYGGDDPIGPTTVIVKLPTEAPGQRLVADFYRFYEREAMFYSSLAGSVGVTVPRCYLALTDPSSNTHALVLEDLAPARCGDQLVGATSSEIDAALRGLARLHASRWGDPGLDALPWLPGPDDPMYLASEQLWTTQFPAFRDAFGHLMTPEELRLMTAVGASITDIITRWTRPPFTITHGDARLDNMFFLPDGEVALVDWQLAARSHTGAFDLVYFLAANVPPAVREARWDDLLATYAGELHRCGVSLSDDELAEETQLQSLVLLLYLGLGGGDFDLGNERGERLFEHLRTSYLAMVQFLGADALL